MRCQAVRVGCAHRHPFTGPAAQPKRGRCGPIASATETATPASLSTLQEAYKRFDAIPPSQKFDFSGEVLDAFQAVKAAGSIPKWGVALEATKRRSVMQNELRQVGIKNPGAIAVPSVRNDAAFLATVVLSTSVLAVIAGVVLPGDLGGFAAYGIGGISIVVLAIGSTSPGLLQFFIDKFSLIFPDYKERVTRHEAAHFLVGYLAGCPVTSYSILLGQERVEFAEARLQKRLYEKTLEDEEVDTLAIVAVAGIAAEGQQYEEVMGQTADLLDLQRILLRSKNKLSDQAQQNMTRWAVMTAGGLLRRYKKEHEAVIAAMSRGASVFECIRAIEEAGPA